MQPADRQLHHLLQRLYPLAAPGAPGQGQGYTRCGGNQKSLPCCLAAHQSSGTLRVSEATGPTQYRDDHPRTDKDARGSADYSIRLRLECWVSGRYAKNPLLTRYARIRGAVRAPASLQFLPTDTTTVR